MKLIFDYLVQKGDDAESKRDIAWYNIVMLSVSMLLTYSTLKTLIYTLKILVWEIHLADPRFNVNTDIVLGCSILLLSFTYFLAPWIVFQTDPRIWIIIFSLSVIAHIALFLYPIKYVFYVTTSLVGITAALSSIAQTYYINMNSFYGNDVPKHSEVFWAIIHGSMLVGNIAIYIIFKDNQEIKIPLKREQLFYAVLLFLAVIAFIFASFLGQPIRHTDDICDVPWLLYLKLVQMFLTTDSFLLTIIFAYNGLQDTFMTGVYGNVIGFTKKFQTHNVLRNVTLSGMTSGIGMISGVIIISCLKKCLNFKWHFKCFSFGASLHLVSYILIIINIPNDAVLHPTDETGFISTDFNIAIFCSFLQGFGHSFIHTKLYALLIEKYKNRLTSPLFLKVVLTKIFSAAAYFYTSTQLYIVVGILQVMVILATISFFIVECHIKTDAMQFDEYYRPTFRNRY